MQKERCLIRGFSIVEVLLAMSIFGLLVVALMGSYLYGQEATQISGNRARAALYAEEGLEAVRNIRDAAFSNLTNGTYGAVVSSNQWTLSGSSDTNDIFTRQIVVSSIDTNRKSVVSTVSWQQNAGRTGAVSVTTRFTNWLRLGIGNWAIPTQEAVMNFSGSQDGVKVQTAGSYAYVVRNSGTPNFLIINVATPSSPVVAGSLTLTGNPTNIAVSGNYAYVSNQDNNQELQIINIATPATPVVAGVYDSSGNGDVNGVFVNGTTAYLTLSSDLFGPEFEIINVATPASPILVGSVELGSTAYESVVIGNYAYISSGSNTQELQVVNITTPISPTLAGTLNLSGSSDALTITGTGSTIYIGQSTFLYVVNVSTPNVPALVGTLNTSGTVNDVALGVSNTYVFIADSNNSAEFQIANVTIPASPTSLGTYNVSGNSALFGVTYDANNDRAYAVGNPDSAEFFVFAPQ